MGWREKSKRFTLASDTSIMLLMSTLSAAFAKRELNRRKVMSLSNEALNLSKRAIFALHRDDQKSAQAKLNEAEARFKICDALIKKEAALAYEGSFLAALEEHAEAQLFLEYLTKGKWSRPLRAKSLNVFLGGLADFTGELVRYAVKEATRGNQKIVQRVHRDVESVVGILMELDLTGNLRQKFDQAKRNLRQMEQIIYELALASRRN